MVDRLLQNALGKTLWVINVNRYGSPITASGVGLGQSPAA